MLMSQNKLTSSSSIDGCSTESVELYWHPSPFENVKEVMIIGDWSKWSRKEPMNKRKYHNALSQGWHEYKFMVDGVWRIDRNSETVKNQFGSVNNIIQILPKKTYVKKHHKGVLITLSGHLAGVTIQGSWDNWANELPLEHNFNPLKGSQESFKYLDLEAEKSYEFKFKYEGEYFVENKYPTVINSYGTLNNFIIVYENPKIEFNTPSPMKKRSSAICLQSTKKQLKGKIFKWNKIIPDFQMPYDRVEGHSMCNVGQNIYIFGGQSRHQFYNSFIKINSSLNKMECLEVVPDVRAFHTMNAYGNKIIIYGGHNSSLLEDLHIFNVSQGKWEESTVMTFCQNGKHIEHQRPTCVLYESLLVCFGGCHYYKDEESLCNKLKILDIDKRRWVSNVKLQGEIPEPRYGHAAALIDSDMFIFGGIINLKERLNVNDLWKLHLSDFHKLKWQKKNPTGKPPLARHGHSMNQLCNLLVIFGGRDDKDNCLNDLHIYNTTSDQWIIPLVHGTIPKCRYNHAASSFPGDKLIMFGGKTFDNCKTTAYFVLEPAGIPRSTSFEGEQSDSQDSLSDE